MNKAYQTPRSMLVMMNSFLRCNALMDQRIKSAIAGGTLKRGTWGRGTCMYTVGRTGSRQSYDSIVHQMVSVMIRIMTRIIQRGRLAPGSWV